MEVGAYYVDRNACTLRYVGTAEGIYFFDQVIFDEFAYEVVVDPTIRLTYRDVLKLKKVQ